MSSSHHAPKAENERTNGNYRRQDGDQSRKGLRPNAFEDEHFSNLGLEEVSDQSNQWEITLGFSRPWDETGGPSYLPSWCRITNASG